MRSRLQAVLGSALFLVLVPGSVAGLLPWLITRWTSGPPLLGLPATRWAGASLLVLGLPGLLDAFGRFALLGRGTPSPSHPTERPVVSGLYRHVRNPMYVAVLATILGQALLLGSRHLVLYAVVVFAAFNAFVLLVEEPSLRARFGTGYATYCRGVGRWWPRLTPWRDDLAGPAARA